jgi:hypothetical protein
MEKLSASVQNLLKMALCADRNGCLKAIPTMTEAEINTIIDPSDNSTFLSKACAFGEVAVVEQLLKHGAVPSTVAWIAAVKSGDIAMMRPLASHITPALIPNAIFLLLDKQFSETNLQQLHQLEIIKVFLEGANKEVWLSAGEHDSGGTSSTYLHAALNSELIPVAQYLVQADCCADYLLSLDDEGLSPLQLAESRLLSLLEQLRPSSRSRPRPRRSRGPFFSRHGEWVEVPDDAAQGEGEASDDEEEEEEGEEEEGGSEGSGSVTVTSSERSGEEEEEEEDDEEEEDEEEDEESASGGSEAEDDGGAGEVGGGGHWTGGLLDADVPGVQMRIQAFREVRAELLVRDSAVSVSVSSIIICYRVVGGRVAAPKVILSMVEAMGAQTALASSYGFNHR